MEQASFLKRIQAAHELLDLLNHHYVEMSPGSQERIDAVLAELFELKTFLDVTKEQQIPGSSSTSNWVESSDPHLDRVGAAEELKQAIARLRFVLSSITELYAVFDQDWRIVDVNQAAEQHYFPGQPAGSMVGKNLWEVLPDTIGGEFYHEFHRAMQTGQPVHFEGGSRITGKWYEVHAYPRAGQLEVYMHDISDRKQSEQYLERYQLLFERSRDIFLTVRLTDGQILEANPAAERAYGYPRAELLALTIADLRPPETQSLIHGQIEHANTHGILFETVHRGKDGRTFPVEVSSLGAEIDGERVLLSIIRDISDRKVAEDMAVHKTAEAAAAALEAQRQAAELEALFTQMNDGVVVYDLNGTPVRANAAVIAAFGFDPAGIPPDETAQRLKVTRLDGTPWMLQEFLVFRALQGETVTDTRLKLTTADGQMLLLSASGNPIRNNGQISGAVIVYHDITERERLEVEYLRQKALLDAIFEADPSGLAVLTGTDLRFAYVNPAYRYITPDPVLDPIGKPFDQIWPQKSAHFHRDRYRKVLRCGQPFLATGIEHTFPDGSRRSFTLQARRIEWETQNAVLVIMWDTTELHHTEVALRESEARLNRAQEISHLGSWELDLLTNRLTWSDEIYRIFGLQPQAFGATYEAFLEAVHPEDRNAVDDAYTGSIRDGRDTYEIEHRVVQKSTDEIRVVHEKCEHTRDESGRIIRSVGMVQDITDRKRAEQALAHSEQRVLTILKSITDCCYTLDPQWRFISVNEPALAYFQKSRQAIQGQIFWDVFPQARGTLVEENYRKSIQEQQPVHYDVLSPISGRWVEVHAYPSTEGLLVILRDITERKQMDEDLRKSEERYHSLFENMRDGFAYCQMIFAGDQPMDFIYLDVNPAFEKLTGLKNVTGKKVTEVISGIWQTNPEIFTIYGRVALTGQPESFELDFTPLQIWLSISVYSPAKGYFVAIFDNISERKQDEARIHQLNQELTQRNAELVAEHERWQGVVEGIADEVWVCDLQGKMTLINLPSVTAMGLKEFKEKTYAEVLDEVDILTVDGKLRPADQAPLLRSLRGEILRGEELMRHRQTSRMRYRQYSSAPMHDASGRITGSVAIVRDITEAKQAEVEAHARAVQVELQQRLLEQREQERLQIARDLHDGPVQVLTGITLALRGLLMDNCNPQIAQQLEAIQTDLQVQIGEMRAYAGELRPPALSKFGLGKAIRSHLDSYQEKHPEVKVSLVETQDGDLLPEEIRLAFYRIYQEALTNIAKHAQATAITVQLEKTNRQVTLAIVDNGVGFDIPTDWLELARHKHLGLVGIRERTEAVGGKIEIDSQKGIGTHIKVTVPLK